MSSAEQIAVIPANTVVVLGNHPFTVGNQVAASSASAGVTLRGVNRPGSYNASNEIAQPATQDILLVSVQGGTQVGTDVTFDPADYPALANAHVDGGTLDEADRLRVVVQLKGANGRTLGTLHRVAASADPASGEFKTSAAGLLTLGEIDLVDDPIGYTVEVWLIPADKITEQAIPQTVLGEIVVDGVVAAEGGEVRLSRLG
jgi:hypothetical protein